MRKLTYALAAFATLAVGAPTGGCSDLANAAGVGIYVDGDRDYYGDRCDGPRIWWNELSN